MSNDKQNLWETRTLPGGTVLELNARGEPALVLVQGENQVRVELAHAKVVVATLTDVAADLAGLLVTGRV